MGSGDRKGRWRIASRCTVVNVMGGADLDLRDALIDSAETVITVFSLMGGSDIVVPDGVEVELGGFALMGANDLELEGPRPQPGAPVVRVRAFSLMGGTDVKTKPGRRRGHLHHPHRPGTASGPDADPRLERRHRWRPPVEPPHLGPCAIAGVVALSATAPERSAKLARCVDFSRNVRRGSVCGRLAPAANTQT